MNNNNKKKFNIFDIFRDLEKFYGVLYMFLLGFIIFLGAKYVSTLDYNKIFSAPTLLLSDTNMLVQQPIKRGTISPPVDVMKLGGALPDDVKNAVLGKGKDLYNTNCASCHGENGDGKGPAGAALNPPPRNFVNSTGQTWKNGEKISQMYVTLQDGIPNTGMASFANITPEDRFAILHYVQTFNPTFPKDNPDDLVKLDEKYSLSKGLKQPNQIPVDLAMDLVLLESDTLKADLKTIGNKIETDKSDSAVAIFNEIVADRNKALNSLGNNMNWSQTPEEFMQFLFIDPVDKGFKGNVYQLSTGKGNLLYQYLKNLFAQNRV